MVEKIEELKSRRKAIAVEIRDLVASRTLKREEKKAISKQIEELQKQAKKGKKKTTGTGGI